MRTREAVSADKLRGGFYTPDALVDFCLERAAELAETDRPLRVLEPAAGDGAFARGLVRSALRASVRSVTALEPMRAEAARTRAVLAEVSLCGEVRSCSAVQFAASATQEYDLAVGNPPFVRYQFVERADRAAMRELAQRLGLELSGVSNLWIPVLLGALSRLAPGGAFAFVVPMELLTGVSAGAVRAWTARNCELLMLDHFPPGSFPSVLQEIGVLSGRRAPCALAQTMLTLVEHEDGGAPRVRRHRAPATPASWTRYLLSRSVLDALALACGGPSVGTLGEVASFEVSTVTGANDFFSATDATVADHDLAPWALPLLPRVRHAPGLILAAEDLAHAARRGARTNLLDFSAQRPDPRLRPLARAYLAEGEARGLPGRYKCRIREPWFRVPGIRPGTLLLSKRSHHYPRVIVNEAGARTTDTIYRGEAVGEATSAGVAAGFHNSLTLLSAELEGRSFGGGVLELVPTEIARLAFPASARIQEHLPALDRIARTRPRDELVRATDALLLTAGIDEDVIAVLARAREELRDRRLARNRRAESTMHRAGPYPERASASLAANSW
ncbi:MAG: SAM-dependent methyltransferase [Solirubrobacteraceae bacterium]